MRPGKTSRTLTRLAAAVALAVTVLPPLGFFFVEREGLIRSLEADAKVQAIVVLSLIHI